MRAAARCALILVFVVSILDGIKPCFAEGAFRQIFTTECGAAKVPIVVHVFNPTHYKQPESASYFSAESVGHYWCDAIAVKKEWCGLARLQDCKNGRNIRALAFVRPFHRERQLGSVGHCEGAGNLGARAANVGNEELPGDALSSNKNLAAVLGTKNSLARDDDIAHAQFGR